ncbi:MAG: Glu-tRNA(Gln) amidotransferase subunit GatD [archaeon]|nr:Glu-tRNA(Gln) amidotransferase subunit GatD [archaeon]MCR4323655.1 Glu-tRNA(Gln) amidotransferase subunit GatD [Nanoarchaeota archaeon]
MKTKTFSPGDLVSLRTKDKSWQGHVLESYDPSVILLKLKSGYNVGIREGEILDARVTETAKDIKKPEVELVKKKGLRNVVVIITGGTISSRLDSKTGGVIATDVGEILKIAPKIGEICNIVKIESPFMKMSEDMDHRDWKKIAEVCEGHLNDSSIDGLIITHGTDTLHYASAALAFFLGRLNKPVALTYSQRSIDRGSTDASLNLICAAKYAVSDIAEVALVGHKNSDDNICLAMPATKVRKMHTSRRDAFKIVNGEAIAEISSEKFKINREFNARDNSKKVKLDVRYFEKVALIKVHPGQDPSILEYYEKLGYKGIILEVTGLGHVPGKMSQNNWLPKIKRIIDGGIVVCATPQTIFGRLNLNVYSSGRDLQKTGIVFLGDMLSETALVKLGWVLGHKKWNHQEKMLENVAGEVSKC